MLKWFRKNADAQEQLLDQVREINQRLQQVIEENNKLEHDVKMLREVVKQKDLLISEAYRRYKVFNGLLLSEEQSAVVDLLEFTNDCYFITGKAGTGKSTILNYFLSKTKKKVVTLAPTGIAANIIHGRTIHSFFGLSLAFQDVKNPKEVSSSINAEKRLIDELQTIIIDEASMVRSDVMDMIDQKLRVAKDKDIPYGGVQMILFGDLFQLPPVVKETEPMIQGRYKTPYFFGALSEENNFVVCSLKQVFRQTDEAFIRILNRIRTGTVTQLELNELNKACRNNMINGNGGMYVVPTNKKVNEINESHLRRLSSPEHTYHAHIEGDATEDDSPTTESITLKVGAVVMMLSNDKNGNYFGSIQNFVG